MRARAGNQAASSRRRAARRAGARRAQGACAENGARRARLRRHRGDAVWTSVAFATPYGGKALEGRWTVLALGERERAFRKAESQALRPDRASLRAAARRVACARARRALQRCTRHARARALLARQLHAPLSA